jgi:hypothetical protein
MFVTLCFEILAPKAEVNLASSLGPEMTCAVQLLHFMLKFQIELKAFKLLKKVTCIIQYCI